MNKSVAQYRRALKKLLFCSSSKREQLMLRFQSMLNTLLADCPAPTKQELYDAFGSPEELANTLSEEITQEDTARYRRMQKARRIIAGILVGLLLIATVYVFFIKHKPITSYDEGIAYPTEQYSPLPTP